MTTKSSRNFMKRQITVKFKTKDSLRSKCSNSFIRCAKLVSFLIDNVRLKDKKKNMFLLNLSMPYRLT